MQEILKYCAGCFLVSVFNILSEYELFFSALAGTLVGAALKWRFSIGHPGITAVVGVIALVVPFIVESLFHPRFPQIHNFMVGIISLSAFFVAGHIWENRITQKVANQAELFGVLQNGYSHDEKSHEKLD